MHAFLQSAPRYSCVHIQVSFPSPSCFIKERTSDPTLTLPSRLQQTLPLDAQARNPPNERTPSGARTVSGGCPHLVRPGSGSQVGRGGSFGRGGATSRCRSEKFLAAWEWWGLIDPWPFVHCVHRFKIDHHLTERSARQKSVNVVFSARC